MAIDYSRIKAVATDIDGTLTDQNRRISLKGIDALRLLEKNGIKVILVSSNIFPVVSALAKYIGVSGLIIAESGAVIGYPWQPIEIIKRHYDKAKVIEVLKELGFKPNYANEFTLVDLQFRRTDISKELTEREITEKLKANGINGIKVYDSGFAVHIVPKSVDKGSALSKALKILDLTPEEVIIVGDGKNDIPMFSVAKISMAPANAVDELKKIATIVYDKPNGEALYELAVLIINRKSTNP